MKMILVCVAVIAAFSATHLAAENTKPNIVLIISDDQAWTDYGFMGHATINTPHLDKLAGRSLLFERGYVAAPLCRPSLASMVTGLYPSQHGVAGNDVDGRNNRAALDVPLRKAFHKHPSIVRMLVSHGYLAHQSGKWWEGSWKDGGFTHGMTHGDPKRGGRHGDAGLAIGRKGLKPIKDFVDLALAEKKPFFVWYAPFLPHTPHNPPPRLLRKYTKPGRAPDVAKYYAMCEWFDETCGELVGYLDTKKIADNTLVLYICDNGWAAVSTNADDPHQKLWKGYAQRSKSSPYENGIRTPIMVSWPDRLKPDKSADFAHAIDLFPTIAAAAGVESPTNLTGINLMDATARKARERLFGVCHATHNMTVGDPDDTLQYLWCVEGDWKLLVRCHGKDTTNYRNLHVWDTAPVRLYNVTKDPHEMKDVAKQHPEIVARLKKVINTWHGGEKGRAAVHNQRGALRTERPTSTEKASASLDTDGNTISLFDGETLNGWVTLDDKPITKGWEVADGMIHVKVGKERPGHIKTKRVFENFELEFEWRVAEGGNSGVKYLTKESDSDRGRMFFGPEYQLLDDMNHKNGRTPNKTAGALYDLYAPNLDQKRMKPRGQFNHGKIVVDHGRIEHWLNGRKVVTATIGSDDWQRRRRKSKLASVEDFAIGPGVILLQEHLSEAWFRNIRIKPLKKIAADNRARTIN